jgi:tetratricopeptide (TPR) repeat protein
LLAELTRASQSMQSPTIEQLLDAASSKADDATVDSLVREQLYQTLLNSYAQLHAYEKSAQMGLKLVELIEQRAGTQSPELIMPLRMIVASMTNTGQHHEMLGLLKRAVMLANEHLPATDSTRYNLLIDASLYAAFGLSIDGDTSRSAIDRLEELVSFGKRTPEIDRAHVVRAMEFLSDRYIQALEPVRAYEVIVQAVQIAQSTPKMPRERLLRALLGQGSAASILNRTQEAVDVINQTIALLDANVREDRQLLGVALSYRATAQLSEHDATLNRQALSDGKQAKAIKAEFPGMASSVNIVDDRTIATAMAKLGQHNEALEMLDATIASAKARHMSGLADRSVGLDRASILFAMGKTNDAEQAFAQLLRNAGDSSWLRFNIFRVMASTFDQRDDYRPQAVEAAKASIEELALARKGSTSWHPRLEDMQRIIDKHAAEK